MLFLLASIWLAAAQADCPIAPSSGASLPMAIDLGGRPSVAAGTSGQVYLNVPILPQDTCVETPRLPVDVLRGEPGNLLNPSH
jgi:hypothetical protein